MKTIVELSLVLMEIMLCETSKWEDGLSEYFGTSVFSMNEKMKSSNSPNKYWGLGSIQSYQYSCHYVRGMSIPAAAQNVFYGHCTLQEQKCEKESSHFYFVMLSTSPRRPARHLETLLLYLN